MLCTRHGHSPKTGGAREHGVVQNKRSPGCSSVCDLRYLPKRCSVGYADSISATSSLSSSLTVECTNAFSIIRAHRVCLCLLARLRRFQHYQPNSTMGATVDNSLLVSFVVSRQEHRERYDYNINHSRVSHSIQIVYPIRLYHRHRALALFCP